MRPQSRPVRESQFTPPPLQSSTQINWRLGYGSATGFSDAHLANLQGVHKLCPPSAQPIFKTTAQRMVACYQRGAQFVHPLLSKSASVLPLALATCLNAPSTTRSKPQGLAWLEGGHKLCPPSSQANPCHPSVGLMCHPTSQSQSPIKQKAPGFRGFLLYGTLALR